MTVQQAYQTREFNYQAQTTDSRALSGTLRADDADDARAALEALGLHVIELEEAPAAARVKALRGTEFAAFNHQLAQLTAAGLPVEQGLRLIARDMRSGRLAAAVNRVADELEAGTSLADTFAKHRSQFPPLYGRIVDAGVRTSNLPEVLFNLGRHIELVQRLRMTLWRAAAYPLMLLVGIALVLGFLGLFVVPGFRDVFVDFDMTLPPLTTVIFHVAEWTGWIVAGIVGFIFAVVGVWAVASRLGHGQSLADNLLMPLPIIGPILRRNLVARWTDALRVGVQAGMDLPAAFELAGDAVASPRMRAESQRLIAAMEAGGPIDRPVGMRFIPATVPAAIQLASQRYDLAGMLENLSQMYQQQAELRLGAVQTLMTPALLIVIALVVGLIIGGLLAPLVQLMHFVM
ncbi:MAG: type II secretion system F family protein [Phycisphaeraceae bacterium]